ncbi:MAG: hypothetical protein FRX49_01667, partial [Trebouxia sp. A1-2]
MQGEPPVSNQQGKRWLTAAKLGEPDTLAALLQGNPALLHYEQGADINCLNTEDSTPLHAAAANGQQDIVRFLLDQSDTKVDARDSSNETAQQVAKSKKWLAVAALFTDSTPCEATADQASISPPDTGTTARQAAAAPTSESTQQSTSISHSSSTPTGIIASGDLTAAASVIREHGKAWLDAARYGKLHSMKGLLKAAGKHKADLVAYSGAGTSYALMGHTALHWAAAKGYTEALGWLLQQGADADSPNQGGSTSLHSAAGHGQATAAEMLLYMGCANGSLLDMSSESPRSLALSLGHANIARQIDLAQHVNKLRGQAQSGWDMRSVRELLQLAGTNMAALLERHEVMTACQHQLDRMPKPVGLACLRPFTCTPTGTSASPLASNALPAPPTLQNVHDAGKPELSNDEDEAVWTQAAATAKQRGNEKYQRAEHQQAVQLYTMAINLQTEVALSGMAGTSGSAVDPLAVMYSNRSAANMSLARWNEALEDAEACTTIAPDWSK